MTILQQKKRTYSTEKNNLFSSKPVFDTIEGQYILQSKKIRKFLKYAHRFPKRAKKILQKHKRILLNSGMGSGKTYTTFGELMPAFRAIYGKELITILISPRLLLLEQLSGEELFEYFSSSANAQKTHKFDPKETKNVLTTFQSAVTIISKVKEFCPTAPVVLFVDEAHILYDSSFMSLHELNSLIKDNSISNVVGLSATVYKEFEKDWRIMKLARTVKPNRKLTVAYTYAKTQKEARFKAMQKAVNHIKENQIKTAFTYIKGIDEGITLAELMNIDLEDELKQNKGKAYSLSSKSSASELEKNKFRTEIIEKEDALEGSHLVVTSLADVAINMKKQKGNQSNKLDLTIYIADSDHSFVNPTKFLQLTGRDRDFHNKDILLIRVSP